MRQAMSSLKAEVRDSITSENPTTATTGPAQFSRASALDELRSLPSSHFNASTPGVANQESVSSTTKLDKKAEGSKVLDKEVEKALEGALSILSRPDLSAEEKQRHLSESFKVLEKRFEALAQLHGWNPEELKRCLYEMIKQVPLREGAPFTFGDVLRGKLSSQDFEKEAPHIKKIVEEVKKVLERVQVHSLGVTYGSLSIMEILHNSPGYSGNNVCGPEALYYLLAEKGVFGGKLSPREAEAVGKILLQKTAPGIVGTAPERLAPAVEAATNGKYTLATHKFGSSEDAFNFAISNVPCVIKFGSSLTSQHYDTIVEVIEGPQGRIIRTSSGLCIPEEKLKDMMGQMPYSNHVWTLEEK